MFPPASDRRPRPTTILAVWTSTSSTATMMRLPWRRTVPAGDIVDVQSSPGVLGPDAAFREGEDRAPRDHEQAPQFG